MKTLILEIKGNSLDDGPGIRTVVFFKGCPLNCVWCHNPESKKAVIELSWDKKECIACLSCAKVCPEHAIDLKNQNFVDRKKCSLCFNCVDVCPSGAMSTVGRLMTVEDVMQLVLKDKPFFDTSGGGVTLSGGEPLMNIAFASELLQQCKRHNIHTLVETSGYFNWDEFETCIAPYCNTVYYDIKLIGEEDHKKYCGVSNTKILKNFKKLIQLSKNIDIQVVPRIPLVPGITATEKNLTGIAEFVHDCGVDTVELLRYNPLWPEKCMKIGINATIDKALTQWMTHEEYERCKQIVTNVNKEKAILN